MEIIIFIVFIFGLFYLLKLKSPAWKGSIGESIVARKIDKLPEQKYRVFNNVYLKTKKGSSQIDHIVISIYGIFVIETKNYSGWIFGDEKQEYWTQTIYKHKYKFRNPIKQNWGHIYALKELLSHYNNIKYFPIIVFTGDAELRSITSSIPVIYENNLYETIVCYSGAPVLSLGQVNDIATRIAENNIQDKGINKKHIQNIYHQIDEQEEKINSLICPKCGRSLIVRNGKYGSFYGCSNYPDCRFKRSC